MALKLQYQNSLRDEDTIISADIGGTRTRIAAYRGTQQHIARKEFPTAQRVGEQIAKIGNVIESFDCNPVAIGISFTGRICAEGRRVTVSLNLPSFEGFTISDEFQSAFGVPTFVAHDATCGLVAELTYGALRDRPDCAYITASTGVGGAIRIGDSDFGLVRTVEVGHQLLSHSNQECLCGQFGCLESHLGGRQVESKIGTSLADIDDEFFWEDYTNLLAIGVVNLAANTGVEAVCIGGGIATGRPDFVERLSERVAVIATYISIEVLRPEIGSDAPLVGAALLPRSDTTGLTILH